MSVIIRDFNGDRINDLFVASGGGEYFGNDDALKNRLYINEENTVFSLDRLDDPNDTDVVKAYDYDKDGDLDLFVGNATISLDFGNIPESNILENEQGQFVKRPLSGIEKPGMIRDVLWTDFNGDDLQDLILVGEWMPPTFLLNTNNSFTDVTSSYLSENLNGLWRAITPFDIDGDGDMDYLLGNWGVNTKFKASADYPMLMFYDDFDNNNKTETLLAIEKNGKYYTLEGLDELSGQLISLTKKKFTAYKDFAGKTIYEVFGEELLDKAKLLKVHTLASGVLKNEGGKFYFTPFSSGLQVAPINCFTKIEVDGREAVLVAGNYFGVTPYHSRFDGFTGALIFDENNSKAGHEVGLDFFQKAVVQLETVNINNTQYLIALINNDKVQIYKIN